MIHVSLTTLLLLGMIVGLALLGCFWMYAVWKERRQEGRARQDLVSCRICGNVYENLSRSPMTACPQCGSLNEATKPKPI
jgi:hypothetical protein